MKLLNELNEIDTNFTNVKLISNSGDQQHLVNFNVFEYRILPSVVNLNTTKIAGEGFCHIYSCHT